MTAAGSKLFLAETTPKQFNDTDGSWYEGNMKVITSLEEAESALEVIIEQGEGATINTPNSHYQIFKALWENYAYQTYNVVENPQSDTYKSEKFYGVRAPPFEF